MDFEHKYFFIYFTGHRQDIWGDHGPKVEQEEVEQDKHVEGSAAHE